MEISPSLLNNVLIPVVKAIVIVNVMAIMSGVLTIIERRSLAFLQVRNALYAFAKKDKRTFDNDVFQQIWIHFVLWVAFARGWTGGHSFKSHSPH